VAKVVNITRDGYYKSLKKDEVKMRKDKELKELIKEIFIKSRFTYGYRRITQALKDIGFKINRKKVSRIMKNLGLKARASKKFRNTTDSNHDFLIAENILNREFVQDTPNKVWVSDITYIKTEKGWLYLTIIMDLFSRRIIGYSMDDNMKTEMVLKALEMAYQFRKPKEKVLFHSDRGSQYASNKFKKKLDDYGMIQSMSRKGNCWDNAPSESFFHTLKVEEVYCRKEYSTKEEAKACIFDYINVFYNKERIHSTLNYQAPVSFEMEYFNRIVA